MSFTVKRDGDRVVVRVPAQLVVGNRQDLKQRVLDELAHGGRQFLIDFGETAYVDSAGLGAPVSASKHIRQQAGELRLANLNDDLRTLFQLTRLDTLFVIDDDDQGLAGRHRFGHARRSRLRGRRSQPGPPRTCSVTDGVWVRHRGRGVEPRTRPGR